MQINAQPRNIAQLREAYMSLFAIFAADAGEIADELGIDRAKALRLLKRLQEQGLVDSYDVNSAAQGEARRGQFKTLTWQCNETHDYATEDQALATFERAFSPEPEAPSDDELGRCPHGALAGFCTQAACAAPQQVALTDDERGYVRSSVATRLLQEPPVYGGSTLAVWLPEADQDGGPFAWRITRGTDGYRLDRKPTAAKPWSTAERLKRKQAEGLLAQIRNHKGVAAAFAADDTTTEEVTMSKSTKQDGPKTAAARKQRETAAAKAETAAVPPVETLPERDEPKPDGAQMQADLANRIKKTVRGVKAKSSPKGDWITMKVGTKPVAYIDRKKHGVLLRLALLEAPEGVELPFEPCPIPSPRFQVQAKLGTEAQMEEALKAVEAAAALVAK